MEICVKELLKSNFHLYLFSNLYDRILLYVELYMKNILKMSSFFSVCCFESLIFNVWTKTLVFLWDFLVILWLVEMLFLLNHR